MKYSVSLASTGTIEDLRRLLGQVAGKSSKDLWIAEIHNNKIQKYFRTDECVSEIQSHDEIFAYDSYFFLKNFLRIFFSVTNFLNLIK